MPKLERWIIASKEVEVLDEAAAAAIRDLGGKMGSSWGEVHQHICVTPYNKEKIEDLLKSAGFSIEYMSEKDVRHPELHPECLQHGKDNPAGPPVGQLITASRMLAVLDKETMIAIFDLGGHIGGGWCEVHQHVCVPPENREKVEEILLEAGYKVS